MPKVLNVHTDGIPPRAVYIGRRSKWGNPFVIGKDGTRDEVLQKYIEWLGSRPDLILAAQRDLRGRDLICYCAPKRCHGDFLLQIANAGETENDV